MPKEIKEEIKTTEELEEIVSAQRHQIHQLNLELEHARNIVHVMHHSWSWKITRPIRILARIVIFAFNFLKQPFFWKKITFSLERRGLVGSLKHVLFKITGNPAYAKEIEAEHMNNMAYGEWIKQYDTLSAADKDKILLDIKSFNHSPLISIIMPVYNIDEEWLRQAIDSVLAQLYQNFQLCIADDASTKPQVKKILSEYEKKDKRVKVIYREKNGHISESSNSALSLATGEYIFLMDHDDMIPEHALYHVAKVINKKPDVDVIYADEDKITTEGVRYDAYFKPHEFDPDTLFTRNILCHPGVYRRPLIEQVGGFRKGYEGSQDYDLALRVLKLTECGKIAHIPEILYHWRSIPGSTAKSEGYKDYAFEAAQKSLTDYFAGVDKNIKVTKGSIPGFNRIVFAVPRPEPKVSIIIPTRNAAGLMKKCIESIYAKNTYKNFEIIIVDNQSDDKASINYFESLQKSGKAKVLKYDFPFNYSAINNFAVKNCDGEVLLLLNNDIEMITRGFLEELVANAMRPDIGAVGIKLYYPNGIIQHAGVVTGLGNRIDPAVAGHLFHSKSRDFYGYFGRAKMAQTLSGVTAACIAVRRKVFEDVKGFNEENLAVAFNDVDLCLKIGEKGYRILWTPFVEAFHHESATRGREDTTEKYQRFRKEVAYMRKRWGERLDNDPYYSANMNLTSADFTLAFPPRKKKVWEENDLINERVVSEALAV